MKPYLLFAAFAALALALMALGARLAARRRKELAAWAAAHGLQFDPERDPGLPYRLEGLPAFARGSNRYAHNRVTGRWGSRAFLGFDYHYETHSTDSKGRRQTHHHHFSAIALTSELPLKPLFIRPESLMDRVGAFLGFDDIDFESAEFSRRFHVKSPDRKWAYDVLHVRAMEFLLARPTFNLALQGDLALAWRDRTLPPADWEHAADLLTGLLDALPNYLRAPAAPALAAGVPS